jgi:hypothetical protein
LTLDKVVRSLHTCMMRYTRAVSQSEAKFREAYKRSMPNNSASLSVSSTG